MSHFCWILNIKGWIIYCNLQFCMGKSCPVRNLELVGIIFTWSVPFGLSGTTTMLEIRQNWFVENKFTTVLLLWMVGNCSTQAPEWNSFPFPEPFPSRWSEAVWLTILNVIRDPFFIPAESYCIKNNYEEIVFSSANLKVAELELLNS